MPRLLPALALVAALVAAANADAATPRLSVDRSLAVNRPNSAAVRDSTGSISEFVPDRVIVAPRSSAQLKAFLRRWHGKVVGSDAVPSPPQGKLARKWARATSYVVRVDPPAFDAGVLLRDANRLGLRSPGQVSSVKAARLLALTLRSTASGTPATPDFISPNSGSLLLRTHEGGGDNAFVTEAFSGGGRAGITQAWQFVAAHGIARRVKVAVIDGGYWLDDKGNSLNPDIPGKPAQYDFLDDDYTAGGPNPSDCGDSGCPWHGNGSASSVAGALDNGAAAAGSGGQVVDPILLKINNSDSEVKRAVRTAAAWGADIATMSFSGPCNVWCRQARKWNKYQQAFEDSANAGVALFAAAGNSNNSVTDDDFQPCTLKWVFCVSALADDKNTASGISNYNSGFWAPSDVPILAPDGVSSHSGTSASTPVVAGVAAMMKALKPSLSASQIEALLRSTAWTDSPDEKVTRYLNAYAAVSAAADDRLPADEFEPNEGSATAKALSFGTHAGLTLDRATDLDNYGFTLDSYSTVHISGAYASALSPLYGGGPGWVSPYGGLNEGESSSGSPNHFNWSAKLMPPGDYSLFFSGLRPTIYNLTLARTPVTLAADAYEANDTSGTAAPVPNGDHTATLHTASDVDYYDLDLSTSSTGFVNVEVVADFPADVTLIDAAGKLSGPTGLAFMHSWEGGVLMPTGHYTLRIAGDRDMRYAFYSGEGPDPKDLEIFRPITGPRIPKPWDPGEKLTPQVLVSDVDDYVFRVPRPVRSIVLRGNGVRADVLDAHGRVVATSEGARISLAQLQPGEPLLLRVGRVAQGTTPLSYTLTAG